VNLIIPINSAGTCNGGIPPKKLKKRQKDKKTKRKQFH
jgi:hypothetical protein